MEKFILDACCGGRCFWFDKAHPNTLYVDNRTAAPGHCKHRPNHSVLPDQIVDHREMPFSDGQFKMVVFDPPHLIRAGKTGHINKKYGRLDRETWPEDIRRGFAECWRVLQDYGTLIFKWSSSEIPLKTVLALFDADPLFGHTTNRRETTHWLCFMKIPGAKRGPQEVLNV